MSYNDAINYLYGLQKHGIKLGLDKVRRLLSLLGNPHEGFQTVHVAGTNGKGSVSSVTSSILRAHGLSTGLFTSPHLLSFTERIRLNGEQITEAEVVALTEEIGEVVSRHPELSSVTFFEFVTAMASLYFQRRGAQWAVMEVGMGGRLDSTNVILPRVSVITRVGLDHREFLGEGLREIAHEKAGIIKEGVPVVSSLQDGAVEEIIAGRCAALSAPLSLYGRDFSGTLRASGLSGIVFDYRDEGLSLEELSLPLAGEHQLVNASVAVRAASLALGGKAEPALIRKGLESTRWPGRLELVRRDPDIMIDGAHNPEAAEALAGFMRRHLGERRVILVMGVMSDKDVEGIMSPILPLASELIFTAPNYGRAASPEALAERATGMGLASSVAPSVREAVELAIGKSRQREDRPLILITGSFYTIGEALEALGERSVLGSLRESL